MPVLLTLQDIKVGKPIEEGKKKFIEND